MAQVAVEREFGGEEDKTRAELLQHRARINSGRATSPSWCASCGGLAKRMASAAVDLKAKLLARALEFLTLVDCVDDGMLRAFFLNCSQGIVSLARIIVSSNGMSILQVPLNARCRAAVAARPAA